MPSGVYLRTPEMKTGKYSGRYIRTPRFCKKMSENHKRLGIKPPKTPKGTNYHKIRLFTKEDKIIANRIKHKRWRLRHPDSLRKYKRLYKKIYNALRTKAGILSVSTIQQVYEDNIKQYGTLTCIYCLLPILFGKDTLEHKQPLSRGGTNEYENLGIACSRCNSIKKNKTEKEFKNIDSQ